jgi:hypothetical protein
MLVNLNEPINQMVCINEQNYIISICDMHCIGLIIMHAIQCLRYSILYPEFLALLTKYLCQRLMVLQESCKMAEFLKYNKLVTSVVKIYLNTSIIRRCQAFKKINNRWIFFNPRFLSLITPRISGGSRDMH